MTQYELKVEDDFFDPETGKMILDICNEDSVNHPKHYLTRKGIETIDVIEAFTDGLDGIEAVCTANVIKYICRWKKKNGLQDLEKAEWYLKKLMEVIKHEPI